MDHSAVSGLENVLTRNGIWAAGLLGLAIVAAVCLKHHAPTATTAVVAQPTVKADAPQLTKTAPAATTSTAPIAAVPAVPAATASPAAVPRPVPGALAPPIQTPPVIASPAAAQNLVAPLASKSVKSGKAPGKPTFAAKKKRSNKQIIAQRKLQQAKAKAKARKQLAMKRSVQSASYTSCDVRQPKAALKSICFSFNSANLSAVSKARLDKIAPVLIQNKASRYELAGYTDRLGNPDYNDSLAKRRAIAVQNYLSAQGVEAQQLSAKSYGAEQGSSFSQHRRVDVKVIQP